MSDQQEVQPEEVTEVTDEKPIPGIDEILPPLQWGPGKPSAAQRKIEEQYAQRTAAVAALLTRLAGAEGENAGLKSVNERLTERNSFLEGQLAGSQDKYKSLAIQTGQVLDDAAFFAQIVSQISAITGQDGKEFMPYLYARKIVYKMDDAAVRIRPGVDGTARKLTITRGGDSLSFKIGPRGLSDVQLATIGEFFACEAEEAGVEQERSLTLRAFGFCGKPECELCGKIEDPVQLYGLLMQATSPSYGQPRAGLYDFGSLDSITRRQTDASYGGREAQDTRD